MQRHVDISRIELLEPEMVEMLRRKTPAEKLAIVFALNRTMRLRLEGYLRSAHPDWSDAEIAAEVARRMLHADDDEMRRYDQGDFRPKQ
jgi:hypothetical protein